MTTPGPAADATTPAAVLALLRSALADGPPAWLVGGAVRERLRGRVAEDLDVAVGGEDDGAVRQVAREVARRTGGHAFPLSDAYGAWRVAPPSTSAGAWQVDLTPLQGHDLAADLAARDLTVNALAEPVTGGAVVDPFGGAVDLREGRLRAVGPTAFAADPVRVLRLARFASELDAAADGPTIEAARPAAPALAVSVPGERMLPELLRALAGPTWRRGLDVLERTGALAVVLPDATAQDGRLRDEVADALAVVRSGAPPLPEARAEDREALGALVARPPAADALLLAVLLAHATDPGRALALLRPSRDLRSAVTRSVAAGGRIAALRHGAAGPTELHAALGPAATAAPCAVVAARATLGADGLPWAALAERAVRWAAAPPAAPIAGDVLADALGLSRGPELGRLLRTLAVAHDAGEIHSPADALERARAVLAEQGGAPGRDG